MPVMTADAASSDEIFIFCSLTFTPHALGGFPFRSMIFSLKMNKQETESMRGITQNIGRGQGLRG